MVALVVAGKDWSFSENDEVSKDAIFIFSRNVGNSIKISRKI